MKNIRVTTLIRLGILLTLLPAVPAFGQHAARRHAAQAVRPSVSRPVQAAVRQAAVPLASPSDTLSIRFRLNNTRVDLSYAGNARAWSAFEEAFRRHFAGLPPAALCLDIYSGASPEGTPSHNRWLGESRGTAIRRLVRQRLPGRIGSIVVHNEGARWDGLYELVAASREPWRDEVLRIIGQPASGSDIQIDHRELQLRALHGGSVWPVLRDRYLSPLRSGATAVLSRVATVAGGRDTIVVRDTIVMAQPVYILRDTVAPAQPQPPAPAPRLRKPVVRQPVWALKTNIPLLALGTPNLQMEFSLGHKDKWSLAIEGAWSWWTFSRNAYANEIIYGSLELRRWLGRRYRHYTLDGWHIGLGVGGGYGDLEWRSKGYQAEVLSAYVNLGWQRRFGHRKQWAFDVGFGFGFAHIDWRRYDGSTLFPVGKEEPYDDHLMWRETGRTNWPGAVHFNISVGYVFNQRDAAWRRERANARDAERNDYLHFRDSLKAREEYVSDSTETARRQRLQEISLLPRAERRAALAQLKAVERQAKLERKAAEQQARIEAKEQKRQSKVDRRLRKERQRIERDEYKEHRRIQRQWEKTPEGRAAKRQAKLDERNASRQAKAAAKQAKRQARYDKKASRLKARMDARQQRNLEKLEREMQRANQKYNRSAEF